MIKKNFNSIVGVLDLGISNIGKVYNILNSQNRKYKTIKTFKDFNNFDKLLFPGLGIFGKACSIIKSRGLRDLIKEHILIKKKPYYGICLGMQILCEKSEESPNDKGLSIIKEQCFKLSYDKKSNITVPHIGFTTINKSNRMKKLNKNRFYFVHSFYLKYSSKNKFMKSYVNYGKNLICAQIEKENIFASQFHPELSGSQGIKLIGDFLNL